MTCIPHDSVTHSNFTTLLIFPTLLILSSHHSSTLATNWSFYCLYSFVVSRICILKNISVFVIEIIQHVAFSHWFLSLKNKHLSFLRDFAWLDSSFRFSAKIFHCLDGPQLLFHSPTRGHLECFQVSAIRSRAATNIHMQVSVWTYVFRFFG